MDKPLDNSSQGFETFLYAWASYIRGEGSYQLDLLQAAVTMHIRSRGVTVSDMVSNWGVRPETNGQFMIYNPSLDGEVHPLNIVGPAITTNKNACLQSNAAVQVTSANESADRKQIAQRWQRVSDYFERTGWNESKRGFIFDSTQKEGTNLIEVGCKEIDRQSVAKIQEGKTGLAVFDCAKCGVGLTQLQDIGEMDEDGKEMDIPCPTCRQSAPAMVKPLAGLAMGSDDVPVYDITDKTIPFFNFTIDTYGAKVDGLQGAGWLQIQDLKDLVWMQTHFPGRTFTGPSRWSLTVQYAFALARGRWQWLNQQPQETLWADGHERYEVKEIYLHEDSYSSYRAPADYEFIDCFGKTTFKIKKGQTIGEAQKACYGEDQHGFKYLWQEETLLTICPPDTEELNFRDRFSDVHWSRESGAYLSSPNYSIVYVQDDITLLNTLHHNIIARNAVNPIFYDSLTFEQGDFSKEFIGSKNRAFEPDFDIRKSVTALPIPTPSPYLSQQIEFLWQIKDGISNVTPAMRGEPQRGTPFAAQRQQLEQSYGNLTSVLKSFAQCKVVTFKNKAKLAKKRWVLEQFQRVASMFGEIWTEEDVEEMCQIDFDRDLDVSYREGSEMPSTPMTKELRFFGALQQLAAIPPQIALQVVTPDKWQAIVEKLGEFGDFDFDIADLEIDQQISQKRYIALAELCLPFQNVSFDQVQMMKQNVVAQQPPSPQVMAQAMQLLQSADPQAQAQAQQMTQPTPITEFDVKSEQIFHVSGIRFSQYEDLNDEQQFFITQLRAEYGKSKPNEMLIAMIEALLGMMGQVMAAQKQQAQAAQLAANPQIQAAAHADEMAQQDRIRQDALESERTQSDSRIADAKLALEHQKIDIAAQAGERKDILDIAKHASSQEHDKHMQASDQVHQQGVNDAQESE